MAATPAGKGEHRVYRILPPMQSNPPVLTPGKHYLGVEAVAWFINKESSWFTDRMASGTLQITLSSGLEKYQAALGTFELKGGARTAPVFEQPVLPDRNFLGGPISFNASLTAIKKDTVLAGMLKSAASASLGIVAGMVQTASVTGPTKLLAAAGEDLVNGVKRVLSDTGDKREALFDFTGLQYSIQPGQVVGNEIFLLFHRGAALNEKQLSVRATGQLLLPVYGNTVLDDGAWLLLRLRRSDEYSGVREWFTQARSLRGRVEALVSDVETGAISKDDALARLRPSSTGDTTIFDEFVKLRGLIQNDGVLSEREAGVFVGQLTATIVAARKAIAEHNAGASRFFDLTSDLTNSLLVGVTPSDEDLASPFLTGFANVSEARGRLLADLTDSEVFKSARFTPTALGVADV